MVVEYKRIDVQVGKSVYIFCSVLMVLLANASSIAWIPKA